MSYLSEVTLCVSVELQAVLCLQLNTGAWCCALHARFETHPEVVRVAIKRFRYAHIFHGVKDFLSSDLTGLTGKNMSRLQTFLRLQAPAFPALCFLGDLNSLI